MWPQLFGPGWELGLLVAGGMFAGAAAIVWYAMRSAHPAGADAVADLWSAYEQGAITSWEAARLFRILAAQQEAVEPAGRASDEPLRTEEGLRATDSLALLRVEARHIDLRGV